MSTSVTAPPSSRPAIPAGPLAQPTATPAQPTIAPIQPSIAAPSDLSESDVRTLQRALGIIKAARVDAKSRDTDVASQASQRLANILCYVAGFLDAKGAAVGLDPGFQSVFQSSLVFVADPESQLDEFQKNLEDALKPGSTRILPQIIGVALILIGIALKSI